MNIKILGTGCKKCKKLEANARQAVKELELDAVIEKIEDIPGIMSYKVMSTPALVVDEKVLSAGKLLSSKEIKALL
ncbi:thioredoxin family protein [Gottschalkiaceae bacterium SANA]|nr:thioredoxin family protein [Gottschalkiaceae bacterium SANA]